MVRTELDVFQDLAQLCTTNGYVHALAYFCSRDNYIVIKDGAKLNRQNFNHNASCERLIRTEISTLIGLTCKAEIDFQLPSAAKMKEMIGRTQELLHELHQTLMYPMVLRLQAMRGPEDGAVTEFISGSTIREAIFYSGESAYSFQYGELAFLKYRNDQRWFEKEKGFSLADAKKIIAAVEKMQNEQLNALLKPVREQRSDVWTTLPAYKIANHELAHKAGLSIEVVDNFLRAFAIKADLTSNTSFDSLTAFNQANAFPFINLNDRDFLLFQPYSLTEAFYDTPFFWMCSDGAYIDEAMKNRGRYVEQFAAERLRSVFGEYRVHENVDIFGSDHKKFGEIDVLVIFGNRAIVLQAKSKRLTLEARKGNDNQLKDDFKKSVQDAYDQGLDCARCLNNSQYVFMDSKKKQLKMSQAFTEIYIFCVVSDHYPALSIQAQQFLRKEESEVIKLPFVMDVFLLDVLCEMLPSPLYFLSYVNRRTNYSDKVLASHELVILGYHLKYNLWVEPENDFVFLEDDLSVDLDIAMAARRAGDPGAQTPPGILTIASSTPFRTLLKQIEYQDHPGMIDLGFFLLTLNGAALEKIGKSMAQMILKAKRQRNHHDMSLSVIDSGLTIHTNNDKNKDAAERLYMHCQSRKYAHKAKSWFGICINPENSQPRFAVKLYHPWEQSDDMDKVTQSMSAEPRAENSLRGRMTAKIGRNDLCKCGSGKKFKKCCLPRQF